jgi:hypothetical protein
MKITKQQLKQLIKEELMNEISFDRFMAKQELGPDSEPVGSMGALGSGSEPVVQPGMKSGMGPVMRVLESIMEQISATYNSLSHPHDQEDFEKYLNENVRLMTEAWQEDREIEADLQRAPGER